MFMPKGKHNSHSFGIKFLGLLVLLAKNQGLSISDHGYSHVDGVIWSTVIPTRDYKCRLWTSGCWC